MLEAVRRRVRESALVNECVKPNTIAVEEEASYTVVEPYDLKVDFRLEIEVGELSELLDVIEKTSEFSEVSVEEPPHFSDVLKET